MTAEFELERFTVGDGRLEVAGRWRSGESRRFRRVRLLVDAGGRVRRLAPLVAAPLATTPEGAEWSASFRWDGPEIERAELEVGRDLAVALPPPVSAAMAVTGTSAPAGSEAPAPLGPSRLAAGAVDAVAPAPEDVARLRTSLDVLRAQLDAEREELRGQRERLRQKLDEARALRDELEADRSETARERRELAAARAELQRDQERFAAERAELEMARRAPEAGPAGSEDARDEALEAGPAGFENARDEAQSARVGSDEAPARPAPAPRRRPPAPPRRARQPIDLRIVGVALALPTLVVLAIIGDTLL